MLKVSPATPTSLLKKWRTPLDTGHEEAEPLHPGTWRLACQNDIIVVHHRDCEGLKTVVRQRKNSCVAQYQGKGGGLSDKYETLTMPTATETTA